MMYFDQLNIVATHLQKIKTGDVHKTIKPSEARTVHEHPMHKAINVLRSSQQNVLRTLQGILPKSKIRSKKLTQKKLQNSVNWDKWKLSEWQQLDQYFGQKMFSDPYPLPPDANALSLLWCYDIKSD